MFNKRLLVLSCCLLNSGCFLLGPTYTKPQLNIPQKWPNAHNITNNESTNLPELTWWKQFDSLELNGYIQKALTHNGQPQTAMANIDYARSQLEQVKLSWIPGMSALAGFSQFPILGNPGNVVLAYPLYVVNILQLYKQQKSARAIYEASTYAKDCAKLVVIAQTSAAFFTLIAQNESLALNKQLLKDYRTYLKLSQSQFRAGLTSQDSIDQLTSQIKQIHSQVDITKHNIVVSKNALHYLFNENPGNIDVKTSFKNLNSNAIIPGNLPTSVLSSRPDVREAEALLRAANADIGAVTANLLPSITLGAYLGRGGASFKGPINLFESYFTAPIVDLPIFAQISASKARYKALYIKYIVVVREALRGVSNDLSAYSAYTQQLQNNTSALIDEKQRCHLAEQRYRHGIEDNIGVIQCKIKLDQFNLMVNQNKLEKMIAIVNLYQDLAGGYHGS